MSAKSVQSCPKSISSAEGSHAKTFQARGTGPGSPANGPASGASSAGSRKPSRRRSSSSKTSRAVPDVGCPTCGETCTCWGTEPVPSDFLPPMLGLRIFVDESSLLLPTPSASSYGTNQGGAAGRVGKVHASLETMARRGTLQQWATPCTSDEKGPKGKATKGGRNLPREAGGHLNPQWVEWLMGFPVDWTVAAGETDSVPLETPSSPSAPKRSAA